MLELYDKNHNRQMPVTKYTGLKIEHVLKPYDKTLSFKANDDRIQLEDYLRTKTDEYVVKEKNPSGGQLIEYVAVLNLEGLLSRAFIKFSISDLTINEAAALVLDGTGWRVGVCTVTKKRNAGMIYVSAHEAIEKLCTAFMCECVYDTLNKTVSFYDKVGTDKGVYFIKGLNLKKLTKKEDTYDYYTRIIPVGSDGLSIKDVNGGLEYLENNQYSNKELYYIWKDESYTNATALKEDAELKLSDISVPKRSYGCTVIDLAKQNARYSVLAYNIGDTILLMDVASKVREKQRIVKITEYPNNPIKNTCEMANRILTFEELQKKYKDASDVVNYLVAGDGKYSGTVDVSDILNFESGIAGSSSFQNMESSIGGYGAEIDAIQEELGEIQLSITGMQASVNKISEIEEAIKNMLVVIP